MPNYVSEKVANSITLMNIIFGSLSLVSTINQDYFAAGLYIVLAVIMDGADGGVARRLDTCSDIGKQLDSLCDLVSFGVAPALLVYSQLLSDYRIFGLVVAIFFIVCGTYRLARFNVYSVEGYFQGIPITLAGLITALMSLLNAYIPTLIIIILILCMAGLMVSEVKVKKISF